MVNIFEFWGVRQYATNNAVDTVTQSQRSDQFGIVGRQYWLCPIKVANLAKSDINARLFMQPHDEHNNSKSIKLHIRRPLTPNLVQMNNDRSETVQAVHTGGRCQPNIYAAPPQSSP